MGNLGAGFMRAGNLDRRITLLQPVPVRNDIGEETDGWSSVGQVWANVTHQSGGESFQADKREARRVVTFKIRHRAGVNARWRAEYKGEVYEFTDVAEPDRGESLVITAFAREPVTGASGPGGGGGS